MCLAQRSGGPVHRRAFPIFLLPGQFDRMQPHRPREIQLARVSEHHGLMVSHRAFGSLSALGQTYLPAHLFDFAFQEGQFIPSDQKFGIFEISVRCALQSRFRLCEPSLRDVHKSQAQVTELIVGREPDRDLSFLNRRVVFAGAFRNPSGHQAMRLKSSGSVCAHNSSVSSALSRLPVTWRS